MIDGYIGIPYVDQGRTIHGADCWGIILIVHGDAGIELPSYGEISATQLLRIAREIKHAITKDENWIDVGDQPRRAMDVVVMHKLDRVDKFPYHVGIMMSPTRMLHTVYSANSHMVRLTDPSVSTSIIGFRRHKDLP